MNPGRWILGAALAVAAGCGENPGVADPSGPLRIETSQVEPNPANALSAVVTLRVRGADSAAVRFGTAGADPDQLTPAAIPRAGTAVVPVLGLMPETTYLLEALAWSGGASTSGERLHFTTGALPEDLPSYTAGGPDPTPGYVAFAAAPYLVVIDNEGRIVWYHRYASGPGLNFQAQSTGRWAFRPVPGPDDLSTWIEIDPLGRETRTLGCARGLPARFHDLRVEPDGSYWILCDETRTLDLSELDGHPEASVTGTAVQHVSADGEVLFEWSPFDHFAITDLEVGERRGPTVNWTHGNALDLDTDGHLLVSFRNLSEVTKIDRRTGGVIWRLGGLANEFSFPGGEAPAFLRQHSVRAPGPGHLLLLDNLGQAGDTRARRFEYDAGTRTVHGLGSWGTSPPVVAELGGTVQPLPGGRILVAFGSGARVAEFDEAGNVVWEIHGDPGYIFRAQRIRSLYRPGTVYPR